MKSECLGLGDFLDDIWNEIKAAYIEIASVIAVLDVLVSSQDYSMGISDSFHFSVHSSSRIAFYCSRLDYS